MSESLSNSASCLRAMAGAAGGPFGFGDAEFAEGAFFEFVEISGVGAEFVGFSLGLGWCFGVGLLFFAFAQFEGAFLECEFFFGEIAVERIIGDAHEGVEHGSGLVLAQ